MPDAPMRICRICKVKTQYPYCDKCRVKRAKQTQKVRQEKDDRPPASQRGYGALWRKARNRTIRQSPLCRECGSPAQVVHHIDENQYNNRSDNLMALCRQCHEAIHGRAGRVGYGKDGIPNNPSHPWRRG